MIEKLLQDLIERAGQIRQSLAEFILAFTKLMDDWNDEQGHVIPYSATFTQTANQRIDFVGGSSGKSQLQEGIRGLLIVNDGPSTVLIHVPYSESQSFAINNGESWSVIYKKRVLRNIGVQMAAAGTSASLRIVGTH